MSRPLLPHRLPAGLHLFMRVLISFALIWGLVHNGPALAQTHPADHPVMTQATAPDNAGTPNIPCHDTLGVKAANTKPDTHSGMACDMSTCLTLLFPPRESPPALSRDTASPPALRMPVLSSMPPPSLLRPPITT